MTAMVMIWAGHQERIGQTDRLGDLGTDSGQFENYRF
jgi:hypothetical protein